MYLKLLIFEILKLRNIFNIHGSKGSKQQKIIPKEVDIVYIGNKLKEIYPDTKFYGYFQWGHTEKPDDYKSIERRLRNPCANREITPKFHTNKLYTNIETILIDFFTEYNTDDKIDSEILWTYIAEVKILPNVIYTVKHDTFIINNIEMYQDDEIYGYISMYHFNPPEWNYNYSSYCKIDKTSCWSNSKFCKKIIKINPFAIKFVQNQTVKLSKLACSLNLEVIEYINNQTPELSMYVCSKDPSCIQYIRNQTLELQEMCFKMDNSVAKYFTVI